MYSFMQQTYFSHNVHICMVTNIAGQGNMLSFCPTEKGDLFLYLDLPQLIKHAGMDDS